MLISPRIKTTLGWKLNNPGNIERGQPWAGLAPTQLHTRYATFIAPEFSIRVIAYLLAKYADVYGLRTPQQFISRYAPGHENPTDIYAANFARAVGVGYNQPFNVHAKMSQAVKAIIAQEIGYGENPYPDSVIDSGIAMARDAARTAQAVANPSILPSASIQFA